MLKITKLATLSSCRHEMVLPHCSDPLGGVDTCLKNCNPVTVLSKYIIVHLVCQEPKEVS